VAISYGAVIDLRVANLDKLKQLEQGTRRVQSLIQDIQQQRNIFDRSVGSAATRQAKESLKQIVKGFAEAKSGAREFTVEIDGSTKRVRMYSLTLAGLNAQVATFDSIIGNAKVGTDDFNNALEAQNKITAELVRNQVAAEKAQKGLVGDRVSSALGQTRQLTAPGADPSLAMLDRLQSELVETRRLVGMTSQEFEELGQAINKVDVLMGKRQFGPREAPDARESKSRQKARTKRRESLALGAGFPLLMGGGPAQVAGALMGSTVGPGFGGQILGAAIAQQLQDAVARVADLQGAINELNMDKVRDSALLVNEELANQVELLKEAGGKTQAQAVLAQAVYEQFGLGAEASALIKQRTDAVKNAWDRVVGTVSALLALLAQPFIAVLVPILNFVQLVARGWTEIFNLVAKIVNIPGLDKLLGLQGTDEGAGQRGAEMQARARAIEKETKLLQDAFNLEKQRRIGNSLDDKLANARIDAQLKLNELRAKYSADLLKAEGAEYAALRKKQTVEEGLLKLKHGQQVERMKAEDSEKRMMAAIRGRSMLENGLIQLAQKRLDIQNSVASAEIDAQLAVNSLLLQRANNLGDITGQVKLQVQRANLIYRQTVLQVQQEVVKAKLARISAEVKLKELQATVALKEAKGEANAADYAAVRLQSEALKLTELGAKAAERIAASRIKGARATRQAAIEQARFNAFSQQKSLNESAISKFQQNQGLSLGSSRPTKAQATQNYIASMGGRQWTSIGLSRYLAAEGYAQGGFVTRPTNAMVGEGGQPEYVIPASKMNEAIRRYSAGTRGEAVVTGAGGSGGGSSTSNYSNQQNAYYGSGGGTSVNITTGPVVRMGNQNYVSVADMQRGMAAAVNAAESNMMSRMGRSYATRRSMGL
jgi:hypothetical protein